MRRYLIVHLARSISIAAVVALAGLGTALAGVIDVDAVLAALAPAGASLALYWAAQARKFRAALAEVRAPEPDEIIDDLID